MKTKYAIAIAAAIVSVDASAQALKWPPQTPWYSVWHKGWPYTWSFAPESDASVLVPYPARVITELKSKDLWLQQIMTRQVQGDIRGKTVSVTFTVTIPENGGGFWPYRGFLSPDVYGTAPSRVKLFMIGYDALYAQVSSRTPNLPDLTQWSRTQFVLPEMPGSYTVTLSAPLVVGEWTNVNGQSTQAGIDICAGDVKQIGLSLSGGKWFSVGIGSPQPIESTITINSLSVQ